MYANMQGTCLQYLPQRYPTPEPAALAAGEELRQQIEKTQRRFSDGEGGGGESEGEGDRGCAGVKVVVAKDRPDAGMGVKLVHLAANFAFATDKGLAFTAGGDFLSDFVDVVGPIF